MLSLAHQLQAVPVGYSFTKEPVVQKPANRLCNVKQFEKMLDVFCQAMAGNGQMTAAQIATATGREHSGINTSLRKFLLPRGLVRKVGEIPRAGSGMPTYLYEWVGEED